MPLPRSRSGSSTRASGHFVESQNSGDVHGSANKTAIDSDHCIVTQATDNVRKYLVLDPMDHIEQASQLEYALGIPEGTLGKDTARNTLTGKSHQELLVFLTKRSIYNQFCSEETYEYTLVNLLDDAQDDGHGNKLALLIDCPPIRLRVHPCYALCDAVPKIENRHYTSTDQNLKERIRMASSLVRDWRTTVPEAFDLPPPSPRVLSRSSSELSSFHGSHICPHEPVIDPNEPGLSKCCCLGFPGVYTKSSGEETASPRGCGSHINGCPKKVKFAESVDEHSHHPKDRSQILSKWMLLAFAVSVFLNVYFLKDNGSAVF
ncbi:hypothetical protein RhiJN_25389 [Ceratobasidium sp. AG-Ba]|nr:hypothetical protein RhiJN_25389 [Ceratobasidium sp. AG-Ba]